jgi:GDP-L-fucose synthase
MSYLGNKQICVTGGAGFLGRAVCARLRQRGTEHIFVPRSRDFDLTRDHDVHRLFDAAAPEVIIHLAAQVGGIGANQKNPGRFCHANLSMGLNLIETARQRGIDKFLLIGTVCAYPKFCEVPFREDHLWAGYPEETNAPYGVAKRTLGVLLDAYHAQYGLNGVYLIPVNLYGPGDNFDPASSHVIAAMIRKFCEAVDRGEKSVTCWGTGEVSREFLYVDDAADAIVQAAEQHNDPQPINLGTGREITIKDLAVMIAELCGFRGEIVWDASQPAGQPRRMLDTSRAADSLDWRAKITLEEGLRRTIDWWQSVGRLDA